MTGRRNNKRTRQSDSSVEDDSSSSSHNDSGVSDDDDRNSNDEGSSSSLQGANSNASPEHTSRNRLGNSDTRGSSREHEEEAPISSDDDDGEEAEDDDKKDNEKPIKLYKSSRLKSYITLALASFINYDAAQKSLDTISSGVVPSTIDQRRYAVAVSMVSLVLSTAAVVFHLDRITPLQKIWIAAFRPKSRIELALAGFLALWWSIGTGIQTAVTGMAGDGKGQFSFYYSAWVCVWSSFSLLDAWLIATDAEGVKSFITSWPNRAPAWICIMVLSLSTIIWYVDLWKNHRKLGRETEIFIGANFDTVSEGFWQWLITLGVFTFLGATAFVLVEIFRETKEDGSIKAKGSLENKIEGICCFSLVLTWIPTVMVATTPGGPASLIGNAYFFTWLLMIFIFEGMIWYIHDMRHDLHRELKEKEDEYKERQKQVIQETRRIQRSDSEGTGRQHTRTEYFDAIDTM